MLIGTAAISGGRAPKSPAARTRRNHLGRRHLDHRRTSCPAHRRAPGTDLGDRVGHRRAGRGQPIHVCAHTGQPFQPREPDPDLLGMRAKPRQPTPHRRGRPPRRCTDPPPAPTRGPRQQRRPDHCHRIDPPGQPKPGQQHMGAPTATGSRADRPPRPDPPHRLGGLAHEPLRGMPPRRQPRTAIRAHQPTRDQPLFDTGRINTYAQQRTASRRVRTALPDSQSKRAGRAVDFQDHAEPKQPVLTVTPPPSAHGGPTRHPHRQ